MNWRAVKTEAMATTVVLIVMYLLHLVLDNPPEVFSGALVAFIFAGIFARGRYDNV